jgi:phage terminase small subunit
MTSPSLAEPDGTLTDRQLRFVFEYLIDQNASAAAVRAGYSEKSRASQANELMNNEAVRERIRLELSSLLAEAGCSELQLILERKRAAFFRAVKMFKSGWEVLPLDEMEEETRRALEVSTVMGKNGPVIKVRQPDRHKALRALEKVHERLEKINEAYYAKMEREGRCLSLEEIEAMDGGGIEVPIENPEKSQVFSGLGQGAAAKGRLGANEGERVNAEKPMVFSGSGLDGGLPRVKFPEKTGGLSGSARVTAGDWLMRNAPPPGACLRAA